MSTVYRGLDLMLDRPSPSKRSERTSWATQTSSAAFGWRPEPSLHHPNVASVYAKLHEETVSTS